MFTPTNEQGVVLLFGSLAKEQGWEVVSIRSEYPDAILKDRDGNTWTVEFEFLAANFLLHRHDHRHCDLIICWENDYLDCPLPILELKTKSLGVLTRATDEEKALEYWMRRCWRAERAHAEIGLTDQRRNTIRDILLDRGWPGVSELARIIGAGRTTVYRDLDALEVEGFVAINRDNDGKIIDVVILSNIQSLPVSTIHTNGFNKEVA